MSCEVEDSSTYRVLVNHEEQYSIWPEYLEVPVGWKAVGVSGSRKECTDYIEQVWVDMRPLSLRTRLAELEAAPPEAPEVREAEPDARDDLVGFLSTGEHPVEVSLRSARNAAALGECIRRGYVLVRFTDTRGGTEIGVTLDVNACEFGQADFDRGGGEALLVGQLNLNGQDVTCHARIDLALLSGIGWLRSTPRSRGSGQT